MARRVHEVSDPIKTENIEPTATVKRMNLFVWRISIDRGKDDPDKPGRNYGYGGLEKDSIRYFNKYYYAFSRYGAEQKAQRLLKRAKERIDWSRSEIKYNID